MMDSNTARGTLVASALFVGAFVWITRGGKSKLAKSSRAADNDDADAAAIDCDNSASRDSQDETSGSTEPERPEILEPMAAPTENRLKNVFSVKQKPIVHSDTKSDGAKPFSSSYYFAHNTHSRGGGYKDGLKASDYQMNGPRLLSKGGVAVVDKGQNEEPRDNSDTVGSDEASPNKPAPRTRQIPTRQISKYLWDDGDSIAKIHIDSLPHISWEKANVNRNMVRAGLIGDDNSGLSVHITTDEARFILIAPQMYGRADKVSFVVKRHKLLVKIAKTKVKRQTTSGVWAKLGFGSNQSEMVSVPWPRLTSSSAGGVSGSVDIDEKLFKSLGNKD